MKIVAGLRVRPRRKADCVLKQLSEQSLQAPE
jgi:hypothetical protein